MRLAVIDLGTNSVRFDVVEWRPRTHEIIRLHREKLMIRLGEGVFLKRRLHPHSIDVCIEAFKSMARTASEFRVQRIFAFGTSALREARDSERLIRRIRRESGIRVQVISGQEEARLIALGVMTNEPSLRGRYALVDIGGGSTEITVCSGRKILKSMSFPLGTARLQQVFLKTIPPEVNKRGASIELLRRHIRGVVLYQLVTDDWPKVSRIIGSSGTIRSFQKMCKKISSSNTMDPATLDSLIDSMSTMDRKALLGIPGMEARRVDMILAGGILLQECMQALHAKSIETTEFSLRDGILVEQTDHLRRELGNPRDRILGEVFKRAQTWGRSKDELRHTVRVSESIFEWLSPLHRLPPDWRLYLTLSALLAAAGQAISAVSYEFHSAYIARHVDIPGLEDWEKRLIAELCLQQNQAKIVKKNLPFKKEKRVQRGFVKLLAQLKMVMAFSFQRDRPVVIDDLKIRGRQVRLLVSKRYSPDLQILRADQKKQIFEEVFSKELVIESI